jgi:hypothetical protein
MNRMLWIFLIFLMPLSIFGQAEVREVRALEPFDKVVAAHGINVKLIYNDFEEATVRVKGASLDEVITEVNNMTLKVRMKATLRSDITVLVEVSYKQIKSVETNTGATVVTERPLWGEKLKLYAITGGKINAEIDAESVEAIASGASEIEIYGKAQSLLARGNLGADIDAFDLEVKKVEASSKGGAMVKVFASEEADLQASVGGEIQLKGRPFEKSFKNTLGGTIKEMDIKPEHGKDLIRDVK